MLRNSRCHCHFQISDPNQAFSDSLAKVNTNQTFYKDLTLLSALSPQVVRTSSPANQTRVTKNNLMTNIVNTHTHTHTHKTYEDIF